MQDLDSRGKKQTGIAQAMMLGPIWPKLDLGLESDEDILEQFVAHTPELEQEIRLVFSDLSTIVREYEGSVDWIESLKARGYHTYYLSNYGERIRREASKELSFLSHMDGGIMSYTVHLAKPDPAIYQTLLDRYGLKAEECVFLDDTVRNVEAAQALGIAGIVVTSQEQAKKRTGDFIVKDTEDERCIRPAYSYHRQWSCDTIP